MTDRTDRTDCTDRTDRIVTPATIYHQMQLWKQGLVDKGYFHVNMLFTIAVGNSSYPYGVEVTYYSNNACKPEYYNNISKYGKTYEDLYKAFSEELANIPTIKVDARNRYQKALAKAIELGREAGYDDDEAALNPLIVLSQQLSENIITYRRPAPVEHEVD